MHGHLLNCLLLLLQELISLVILSVIGAVVLGGGTYYFLNEMFGDLWRKSTKTPKPPRKDAAEGGTRSRGRGKKK